jgi:hypothetical protein
MFSGFDSYRTHFLQTIFSLDRDVVYPHTVYNENTTLFPHCRKNGCTVPKWTFLSLSCCNSRKGNSASRVFLFRVQDYSKFLFQLFDVFYFKPSNRRRNPLNTGRPDLRCFEATSKTEGRPRFHAIILTQFTDVIRNEIIILPYYWQINLLTLVRTAWHLKMGPISCLETSVTNNQRCVTSQKRKDLGLLFIDMIRYRKPVKLVPVVRSSR